MNEKPVCVVSICKGRCCEELSRQFIRDSGIDVPMQYAGSGMFRCMNHDRKTGLCLAYARRPYPCQAFFCESAGRGFMRAALEAMEAERLGLHARMEGNSLVREAVGKKG